MDMLHFHSGFMPHGGCYLWTKSLIALHATSDALIVLSYYSIPITLVYFVKKRKDLKFNWMFLCFAMFILACGTTHLLEIWNIWHADYWFSGAIKALTALASVPTAILLVKLVPKAVALPSPDALQKAYAELEVRVQERTAELTRTTENLRVEIAERTRAEIQVKASFQKISELNTALDEHTIVEITDPQGNITHVNDKFCAITKYSRAELLGRNNRLMNSGHHPKEYIRQMWDTIGQGKVWHGEFRNRARDGSFFWLETTIVPFLDDTGKPSQYIALHTDITERRAFNEKLNALNLELEKRVAERTADLESFSYSISHDLRSPVRSIGSFAAMIRQDFGDQIPVEASEHLQRIYRNANHMGELIDGLLAFSRLGSQLLNKQVVSPGAIAARVVDELKAQESRRNVQVTLGALPEAEADPILLQQVFANLLSNAFKYSQYREVANIEIGARLENNIPVYFVKDNGAGFDPAYAKNLFGVFQRLHRADQFVGTGVGLAIVHRIIDRHGGRIWAEAAVDQGATFYFTLTSEQPSLGAS